MLSWQHCPDLSRPKAGLPLHSPPRSLAPRWRWHGRAAAPVKCPRWTWEWGSASSWTQQSCSRRQAKTATSENACVRRLRMPDAWAQVVQMH